MPLARPSERNVMVVCAKTKTRFLRCGTRREQPARLFARGRVSQAEMAGELKVSGQSVRRWYHHWKRCGKSGVNPSGCGDRTSDKGVLRCTNTRPAYGAFSDHWPLASGAETSGNCSLPIEVRTQVMRRLPPVSAPLPRCAILKSQPLMRLRTALGAGCLGLAAWGFLLAQAPFKEYPALEYENFPIPTDWNQKTEWTRARLRYPDIYGYPFADLRMRDGRAFPGYWTMDYPRSDRHLMAGIRRLTRIETRSVEQVVSLDGTGEVYNWPTLYAVEVGHWRLPDDQAAQLREFLLRGGFLMVDDFHGTKEWNVFVDSMRKVFPDRSIVEIPNSDAIFHTVYDLEERFQVPGAQYFESGKTYEQDGYQPRWRAIYDDKGRVMVAICHNMDLGDAWEWSDDARYYEKWASLAYRIAVDYFVYDLTH